MPTVLVGVAAGALLSTVIMRSRARPIASHQPQPWPHSVAAPTVSVTKDLLASPTRLGRRGWRDALARTGKQAMTDKITTWAAALTYYAVLSLFPALLVGVAVLRLTGKDTTSEVLRNVSTLTPGPARTVIETALTELQNGASGTAGILAIVGVLGALWSASGYVGAFMEAANSIYDVPEGRPLWKRIPVRIGITVAAGLAVIATALAVVLTGGVARRIGAMAGLAGATVRIWDVAKWPVIVVVVGLLFALLYWAAPNARQGGFRWISPGSFLAVVAWVAVSAAFALYVAYFGSYNKTYGSLAAIIVFLVWLWLSNLAILFGAEFDAELQRGRAIAAGQNPSTEPFLPLRDRDGHALARSSDL